MANGRQPMAWLVVMSGLGQGGGLVNCWHAAGESFTTQQECKCCLGSAAVASYVEFAGLTCGDRYWAFVCRTAGLVAAAAEGIGRQ
ncbi:hypothetical protein NL676_012380 [Syzygium grande]|nr:hypothetical protein NL676_012380 [Syzygium grande]